MCCAASVIGCSAEAIHPFGSARMPSVAAAKLAGVQTGLLPQVMPFSSSTRYFTRVLPAPTTSVPPAATANVPLPMDGTPSLAVPPPPPPVSAPAGPVERSVVFGLGVGLGAGGVVGDGVGETVGDGLVLRANAASWRGEPQPASSSNTPTTAASAPARTPRRGIRVPCRSGLVRRTLCHGPSPMPDRT